MQSTWVNSLSVSLWLLLLLSVLPYEDESRGAGVTQERVQTAKKRENRPDLLLSAPYRNGLVIQKGRLCRTLLYPMSNFNSITFACRTRWRHAPLYTPLCCRSHNRCAASLAPLFIRAEWRPGLMRRNGISYPTLHKAKKNFFINKRKVERKKDEMDDIREHVDFSLKNMI